MLAQLIACVMVVMPQGADAGAKAAPVTFESVLALPPTGPGGRVPFRIDPIQAGIVKGEWPQPTAGDEVAGKMWIEVKAKDGAFQDRALAGGYAYARFKADADRVMILEASGHGMAYFNQEPHTGDPYDYGIVHVPVQVRKGFNELLINTGRGRLSVKLTEPAAAVYFDLADTTLPDLVQGAGEPVVGGLVVTNTTTAWQKELVATVASEGVVSRTQLPSVPPMSVRKVPVSFTPPSKLMGSEVEYAVTITGPNLPAGSVPPSIVKLRVRAPQQTRKVTFQSEIDGSVQYYCVNPATGSEEKGAHGLVLTLHGASVEATNQADAYRAKPSLDLVAPTNRRPFGFDWEDWGRRDAIEVLELATRTLKPDPARVYLTGHSMGGHGTWNIGVLFPDRFAAIAPSAGWISFWSYAGAADYTNPTAMETVFRRAMSPSDTLKMSRNYLQQGVYILHGDADDNVPVGQARQMRQHLAEFHSDFAYYERPGAGHWWGNECVDWPPIFDFFESHRRKSAGEVDRVEFVTPGPGVSASCQWATVVQQEKQSDYSTVKIDLDRKKRTFTAETVNVARLRLDVAGATLGGEGAVYFKHEGGEIDITPEGGGVVELVKVDGGWKVAKTVSLKEKGPHRTGPFKNVIGNRVVLVYGTGGSVEEQAWALSKAKFDAETFWYRGNGAFDIVADSEYSAEKFKDRNVLLYGNSETNRAWKGLLGSSPIQASQGKAKFGDREVSGEDLVAMFVRPHPSSDVALVGAVAPTGYAGCRVAERVGYFGSGVGYPDWTVFSSRVFVDGLGGVKAAGWFGNSWEIDAGQSAAAAE